jgi:hypothetical protein
VSKFLALMKFLICGRVGGVCCFDEAVETVGVEVYICGSDVVIMRVENCGPSCKYKKEI